MAENQNESMDIPTKDSLPDDLFVDADKAFDENTTDYTESHIAPSEEKNTSLEEADKKEEPVKDVSEVVEEELPHKEDSTQFEYWQSQSDTKDGAISAKDAEITALKEQLIQRETVKEQLTPEPLVAPVKPATQFVDDVETWARYYEEKDAYRDKVSEQRQGEFNTFKQESADEKQLRLEGVQAAQNKAYTLGEFQKRGMDLEKANRALNYYGKQRENPDSYYDDLSAFFDWKEKQPSGLKEQQIQQRVDRQGEIPPLGVKPSEAETTKVNENDEFFGDIGKFNYQKYY